MRDKQVTRVEEVMVGQLGTDERVELAVQAIIVRAPAEQSTFAAAARELNKRINARAAVRSEGFAVLTNERFLCLGKSVAMRPTSEVTVSLARPDIGAVEYKRGLMSTVTIWPSDGGDGVALTFGRLLRGQADALNAALGGSPV
jgi:hypothetical protein